MTKDMVTGNSVEVKSEPLSMIGGAPGHHEEVPSSEANVSVTEFISSDLLPPLPHGELGYRVFVQQTASIMYHLSSLLSCVYDYGV